MLSLDQIAPQGYVVTRETFSTLIHWPYIFAVFASANTFFMVPQFVKIMREKHSEGISVAMLIMLLLIQLAFGLHGFFIRDSAVTWSNVGASTVTVLVIWATLRARTKPITHIGK